MTWNQPCCERCWIEMKGVWVTDAVTGIEHLEAVRIPVRLTEPEIEQCSYCGQPTIIGVFIRDDPATVPYSREREISDL